MIDDDGLFLDISEGTSERPLLADTPPLRMLVATLVLSWLLLVTGTALQFGLAVAFITAVGLGAVFALVAWFAHWLSHRLGFRTDK